MKIKELRLKSFGKFSYKNINFDDGINIVYGGNESGKTTVYTFIKGMLYGISESRVESNGENTYKKYMPKQREHEFSGSMSIEENDNIYTITRNFLAEEKYTECINNTTNEEIDIFEIQEVAGLSESEYCDTVSVPNNSSKVSENLARNIKLDMINKASANSKTIDVSAAFDTLARKKNEIEDLRTEQLVTELNEKLELDEISNLQIEALSDRASELIEEMAREADEKEAESVKVIKDYVERFDDIKNKYKEYQELVDKRQVMVNVEENYGSAEKTAKAKFPLIVISLAFILIIVVIQFLRPLWAGIIAAIGVMFMSGSSLYLFNQKVTKFLIRKEYEKEIKKERKHREKVDNYNTRIVEIQEEILEFAKRAYPLSELNSQEMFKLEQEVLVMKKQVEGYMLRQQQNDESLKQELEKVNSELRVLQDNEVVREENKKRYSDAVIKLEEEKSDICAIDMALAALEEVTCEFLDDFRAKLQPVISENCNRITNGRYNEVELDNLCNVSVCNTMTRLDIEKLGNTSIEQINMALRLSYAQILHNCKKMPIILDNSFSLYDDDSLRNTLELLSEMDGRQIIILSSQKREADLLKEMGKEYNLIEL